MIYEIWCNGKLHYTRPEGHPDIQEALDLIERTNRLFGASAYEVRAQQSVHPTGGDVPQKTLICGWCGNHRKGDLNDGVFCSCGGRSWLICTLGCLEDEQPTSG